MRVLPGLRSLARRVRAVWDHPKAVFFFRNVGAVSIALVLCLFPGAGPNRYPLAAFLVFVCVPAASWIERRVPMQENAWVQPLFDLTILVTLVHFVPQLWFPALVIGLIVVQAPSVAESRSSTQLYALMATLLTLGMSFAAWFHDVPDYELPILCMLVLYPSVIYYSHQQARHAAEVRRRAQALEGLHRVAGGVAHDFNNLLTGVMGDAELASMNLPEGHPSRGAIEGVLRGADRATLLSRRLLAFAGRGHEPESVFDLQEELDALFGMLEAVVPEETSLERGRPAAGLLVRAQRGKLQQALVNLVLNASEAREGENRVKVSLEPDAPASRVRIVVAEEGISCAEASGRALDSFFTLQGEARELGLAEARVLVREIEGTVTVEEREGKGARVVVELPMVAAPRRVPIPPGEPAAASGDPACVLVVDDERAVRSVLARMLGLLGYATIEAEDGPSALETFRESGDSIDAVLLDLRMPGMDGWQCLEALRRLRPGLPVLVCSGHDPYDARGRFSEPNTGFLMKPVQMADLREAVGEILGASQLRA